MSDSNQRIGDYWSNVNNTVSKRIFCDSFALANNATQIILCAVETAPNFSNIGNEDSVSMDAVILRMSYEGARRLGQALINQCEKEEVTEKED